MSQGERSTARLDFRLDEDLKKLIEQAAGFLGQSVSAFAVSTLVEKSRQVVEAHTVIRLSDRDRDRFLATLEADLKPNKKLRRAAVRHTRSVIR